MTEPLPTENVFDVTNSLSCCGKVFFFLSSNIVTTISENVLTYLLNICERNCIKIIGEAEQQRIFKLVFF